MPGCDQKVRLGLLVGVCALLGATEALFAADLGSSRPPARQEEIPPARQWTLSFTPYSWLAGLNGDVSRGAVSTVARWRGSVRPL
jgi:hypothetical protein